MGKKKGFISRIPLGPGVACEVEWCPNPDQETEKHNQEQVVCLSSYSNKNELFCG